MTLDEREELIDKLFGELISKRRIYVRYSIEQVSKFASLSVERIIELENGAPSVGVRRWEIDRLAKALGVRVSLLLEFATGENLHEDEKKSQSKGESEKRLEIIEHLH